MDIYIGKVIDVYQKGYIQLLPEIGQGPVSRSLFNNGHDVPDYGTGAFFVLCSGKAVDFR
ncbi:hypothetical protein [Sediminibacillus massiliensis]|uniref:hypothetical protein n=1 Tax=Sediminibacillus massiliensis TaxID=1926277 RepID=UPI00098878AF|nr:hypothetical protein [Sediminibacillus massiliensis]